VIPESERSLIGACGVYCGACGDYLAYVNDDKELRRKAAAEINRQLNMNLAPEEVRCLGCWGEIHTAWAASLRCDVRRCAEEKRMLSCALCDRFPCEKLDRRVDKKNKHMGNLSRIKEIGLDAWLNEVKKSQSG